MISNNILKFDNITDYFVLLKMDNIFMLISVIKFVFSFIT
jgi:hypothetical protein